MAQILNVEKPQFINSVIDAYTKNKIGQYSKFLGQNPIFVTYYHINQAMSRQDVGTGSIETELGERSPIRFNKILNFPIYNLPELRPDINYDEASGYDVELDCSDITILPNTIKPRSGDYFLVVLPGTKEFLFRVNSFEYNTIQSNDYYKISADIRVIGSDLELKKMKGQIVETYLTVFENIGTEDRCFLKSDDVDYINGLADLYHKLRDFYKSAFYNNDLNTFIYPTGIWSETSREINLVDPYLEAFINRAHIYYDENVEKTIIMSPPAPLDSDFEYEFQQSLYYAILEQSLERLKPYCYYYTSIIMNRTSIFNVMGYFGEVVHIKCQNEPIIPNENTDNTDVSCDCCKVPTLPNDKDFMASLPACTKIWNIYEGNEYFPHELLNILLSCGGESDDYCHLLIFNHLHNKSETIDRKEIMNHIGKDRHTFYFLPLVIYIIGTLYKKHFVSEQEIEV